MNELNNNHFVSKVQSIFENYAVILNLTKDKTYYVRFKENVFKSISNFDYSVTLYSDLDENYILRALTYEDEIKIIISIPKKMIQHDITKFYDFKDMKIESSSSLIDLNTQFWRITINDLEDLNKIIKAIDRFV